jgi:hypothetical protein
VLLAEDLLLLLIGGHAGKKPAKTVPPLGKQLRPRLYDRLVERGVLRAEEGRILGIFPTRSWPAQDAAHEAEIAEGDWGSAAVRKVIDDMMAAVMAATTAATVAATTGG